jgi:hypothetical protein
MDSFFAYMQRLELLAFFSGYPLVYSIALFITGSRSSKNNFKNKIPFLLPFAYALVGTLYIGLQLKNLYPDYSIQNINRAIQQPYLITWAFLSIFFWIPALAKKPVFSLLHSLVFFFLLIRDVFSLSNKDIVRNDMNIYTTSLILNLGSVAFLLLVSFLYIRFHRQRPSENT